MREPLVKRNVSARPSEQIMPYGYWPPRLAKCCGDGQLREELPVDEHRGASPSSAELPSWLSAVVTQNKAFLVHSFNSFEAEKSEIVTTNWIHT